MSIPLPPRLLSVLEDVNRDVFAARYLSGEFAFLIHLNEFFLSHVTFAAVGLVALLYDHILTFPEEVSLIWRSPPSFSKYAFILNRYLVPLALITTAFEMCGFSGFQFTDGVSVLFLTIAIQKLIEDSYRYNRGKLQTSHFWGCTTYRDLCSCRFVIITAAIMAVISIGMANMLVLMRVVMLWDYNVVRRNFSFVYLNL